MVRGSFDFAGTCLDGISTFCGALNDISKWAPRPFTSLKRAPHITSLEMRRPLLTYHPPPRALDAAIGPALEAIVASWVAFGAAEL